MCGVFGTAALPGNGSAGHLGNRRATHRAAREHHRCTSTSTLPVTVHFSPYLFCTTITARLYRISGDLLFCLSSCYMHHPVSALWRRLHHRPTFATTCAFQLTTCTNVVCLSDLTLLLPLHFITLHLFFTGESFTASYLNWVTISASSPPHVFTTFFSVCSHRLLLLHMHWLFRMFHFLEGPRRLTSLFSFSHRCLFLLPPYPLRLFLDTWEDSGMSAQV